MAITAAPLAILPFLGLRIAEMGETGAFWTATALAAPAITTLAMTPAWTWLAKSLPLSVLMIWTGLLCAISYALFAIASDPQMLVVARLIQGAAGGGVVLALAFRAAERSYALMQQFISIGCLIGPVLGGIAFSHGRFGLLMLACGILTFVTACIAAFALRHITAEPATEPPIGNEWLQGTSLLCAGMCGSAGVFAFVAFFPVWANMSDPVLYTPGVIGLLHSLSWLVALAAMPCWVRAMTNASPTTLLLVSLIGCAVAFAGVPLGLGFAVIVVLRLFQGAVFAVQGPALFAAVEAIGSNRVAAIANARASLTMGQLLGPFIAGLALMPFGPKGALFAAAGLSLAGVASLIVSQRTLRKNGTSA